MHLRYKDEHNRSCICNALLTFTPLAKVVTLKAAAAEAGTAGYEDPNASVSAF